MRSQLLESTFRRHKEAYVHILRPVHCVSRSGYENILDLESVSKGLSFEDLDFLLGSRERGSRTSSETPAFGDLSHGPSCESQGSPSWHQTRFKLDRPPPFSPFPSQSSGNVWSASYLLPPQNVNDSLRYSNQKRRKSCEYCRFQKKKCSGHSACIRCFRIGIDCVYMPDLIAKRVADRLLDAPRSSLGSRSSYFAVSISVAGSCVSQLPHSDPGCSYATSSTLESGPPETPLGRGTTRTRRKKRTTERAVKCQRKLRPAGVPTQSVTPNPDQYTALDGSPDFSTIFSLSARDVDFWSSGFSCVSSGVLDHSVASIPKGRDAFQPQEVFVDTTATQPPGNTEDDTKMLWFETFPLDINPTGAGAARISDLDATGLSVELYKNLSAPVIPSPSSSVEPAEMTGDSVDSWTVDEWLAWYGPTLFLFSVCVLTYSRARKILPATEQNFFSYNGDSPKSADL